MRWRSREQVVEKDEYGWVQSILSDRGHLEPQSESDDENLGIMVEGNIFRTMIFTLLLGVLACLMIYFGYLVAMGEGRRVFLVMATLVAFLTCAAVAASRSTLARMVFALGALCAFALLVDQLAYYHWNKRVERLTSTLGLGMESGSPVGPSLTGPRPTSFRIEPDGEVVLQFEPPALAWTYHLDAASPVGHTLVTGWYRLLRRVTRDMDHDGVARTIVRPHQVYAVSIRSSGEPLAACVDDGGRPAVSIETKRGNRPL